MAARRYRVSIGDRELEVEIRAEGGEVEVLVDGQPRAARLDPSEAGGPPRLHLGDRVYELLLARDGERVSVAIGGVTVETVVEDERAARLASFGGGASGRHGPPVVAAPMPGLVVRVGAEAGQRITAGQSLVVLQAMKMENDLSSPADGTVKSVLVQPGQTVEHGQVLVELE
jgi:biotin carboxyl carrier protein